MENSVASRWSSITTLKCSRWTMLPTTWASRSYCLSFSGAFMALVYPPHTTGEIGVVGRNPLGYAAAQQRQVLGGRSGGHRHCRRRVVLEAGLASNVTRLVRAFQPKPAPLPREQRLAGQQRPRRAARRDELHLRHQHALGMLLAEQDGLLHHRIHEGRAEGAGEALALRAHQVDAALAVDLRAAEEEHVDAPLPGEVEQLARAFGKWVASAAVEERHAQPRIFLSKKQSTRRRNRRRRTDRNVPSLADQAGDDAGE